MLPNPTVEQKIATGFHRNAMTNEEGGVDPEESRYEVLVDRTNTTATVWLGSRSRAQCHNHKARSLHAEGLLPPAVVLRKQRLRRPLFRRRHAPSSRRSISPRPSRPARKKLQAEIDRLDQQLKTPTPELRSPGPMGRVAARGPGGLDAADAAGGHRDQRRDPSSAD